MKWRFVILIIIVPHRSGILSLIQRLDNTCTTLLYWGLRVSLHRLSGASGVTWRSFEELLFFYLYDTQLHSI